MMKARDTLQHFESAESVAGRLANLQLGDAARPIASASGIDLVAAARRLVAAGLGDDAAIILGQALHRRAAVWWACLASRREPSPLPADSPPDIDRPAAPGDLPPSEAVALAAAEAWVRQPGEAAAQAAYAAAEKAGFGSPAGCAALAAFFAGDSIAPPGGQAVPPPDHVAGLLSATAVQLAAVRNRPDLMPATLSALVEEGFAVAAGQSAWEP